MIRRLRDRHRLLVVLCGLVAAVAILLAFQAAQQRAEGWDEIGLDEQMRLLKEMGD